MLQNVFFAVPVHLMVRVAVDDVRNAPFSLNFNFLCFCLDIHKTAMFKGCPESAGPGLVFMRLCGAGISLPVRQVF